MRIYDPKHWFDILFQFHKHDTARKLGKLICIITLYAAGVAYLELNFLNLSEKSYLKNLHQMHNLLGFALSLLLVFRTNTAYDRWWEGRKLWGSLVNNSRNLAIKLHALLPETDIETRAYFKRVIPMYASVLREHLQSEFTRYALDEKEHPELKHMEDGKHAPNQVAKMLQNKAVGLQKQGILTGEQLLFINPELTSFTDICGACERIKNTPIPYSYSAFIKKFIFVYVMTLPFGYVLSLGYLMIPVVALVFYVLASLEVIAEEIEDPFGSDTNDLPMQKMSENIKKHVAEIL
ncbi:bestrophin family protein [Polluticoccus soli]|uniref:bestrophin family protein n=1 Tax=Polluticoccus soli TaxID=3034150 RepID=UPI0023E19BA3|nr:bestrophin family protein [Flavipsychrobacter sp. JY13-12]